MKNILLLTLILIASNCTINKIENNHGSAFLEIKEKKFLINSQGKIIAEGDQNIKDLYREFNYELLESESSTIAGHVMDMAKKIPLYGEVVSDKFFTYKITSHSRKQILLLEISKNKEGIL